jgi:hypothetical protein
VAEKRKPEAVFLLKFGSNKKASKVEIFDAHQWDRYKRHPSNTIGRGHYRLRVDGKWWGRKGKGRFPTFLTQYEIRDLLWQSIRDKF